MKDFTRDERIMMMLYNPGTRAGLVAELEAMRLQLTPLGAAAGAPLQERPRQAGRHDGGGV